MAVTFPTTTPEKINLVDDDVFLIADSEDGGNASKAKKSSVLSGTQATLVSGTNIKTINGTSVLGSGDITISGAVDSVNGQTGVVVLDADDIDDTSTTNKFVTSSDITKLGNLSGTNSGDVTVSDSSEIDFTLTGQQISASIVAGSIDETKLDASVNASLDLADSALQANQTITLSGDVTGSGTTGITTTIANGAVDIAMLSASGTPDGTTFLRGDNTWSVPAGAGDVSKVGTPVDNQIGVWTGDGTIEGDANFTWDGTSLKLTDNKKILFGNDNDNAIKYDSSLDAMFIKVGITSNYIQLNNSDNSINIGASSGSTGLNLGFTDGITIGGGVDEDISLFNIDRSTTTKPSIFYDDSEDKIAFSNVGLSVADTYVPSSGVIKYLSDISTTINLSSAVSGNNNIGGIKSTTTITGDQNLTDTNGLGASGGFFQVTNNTTGGTVADSAAIVAANTPSAGTITQARGIIASVTGIGSGTTTDAIAGNFSVYNFGSNVFTNAYGIKVEDVTAGGTTNYAIKTGAGLVDLGDTTNIASASADYHQLAGGTGTITDTATGSSADININLVPKGAGRLQAGGVNVPTISSTDTFTNKTIDGDSNTITNVAGFWKSVPGTPTRTSDTVFTITDTSNANLYDQLLQRGTVLKRTQSGTKQAMVVSATYAADTVTVTIIGDTLSVGFTDMKYGLEKARVHKFALAGTIGATGTNVMNTVMIECPTKIFGADFRAGTAGDGTTTVDINKGGTTMFTTKPSITTTNQNVLGVTADNGTTATTGDYITIDVDAVAGTTKIIDAYINLYHIPLYMANLA